MKRRKVGKICCVGFYFRKSSYYIGTFDYEIAGITNYPSNHIGFISGSGYLPEESEQILIRHFFNKTKTIPTKVVKVYEEQKNDGTKQYFYLVLETSYPFSYNKFRDQDWNEMVVSLHNLKRFAENLNVEKHGRAFAHALREMGERDSIFKKDNLELIQSFSKYL